MSTLGTLLRKEILEQWRTMRLPSLAAVFLFIGISSPAFARYMPQVIRALGGDAIASVMPPPTVVDAYVQLAKNVGQIGTVAVIVVTMGGMAAERDRGTLGFVLSKPVPRALFLLAKLLGGFVALTVAMAVAAVASYAYTALLFEPPPATFVGLCLLALASLLVFMTITFAVGAMTRSTAAAGGAGFVAFLALGALSIVPRVAEYTPQGALSVGIRFVQGGGDALLGPALAQVGLVVTALAVALVSFARQEV